jgi:hypothetical protein
MQIQALKKKAAENQPGGANAGAGAGAGTSHEN